MLAATAPGQTQLEWHFKKDDKFFVEETTGVKQTLTVLGSETRQDLDYTRVSRFTVLEKNADGSVVLKQEVLNIKVNQGAGDPNADTKLLQRLQGAAFKITLDPKGRVTGFEGYDALVKKIAAGDEDLAKMVRLLLTEESLKKPIELLLAFQPGKEVAPGDTWRGKLTLPFGPLGALETVNTYEFQGKEKDNAEVVKLSVASKVTYQPPAGEGALSFKVTRGDVKAVKAQGTIWFQTARGRLVRAESTRHLQGTLTVTAATGQTLTLGLVQEQTVKTRVDDNNPLSR